MGSQRATGIITDINPCKNNTTRYTLKTKGNKTVILVDFNGLPIMTHYVVTLCFDIKKSNNPRYPDSNVIYDVKYGDFIKEIPLIRAFLKAQGVTSKTTERLINLYGNATIRTLITEFKEKIATLDINEVDMTKLEKIHSSDMMRTYQEFFGEYDIPFKSSWFKSLHPYCKGNMDEVRKHPYDLYLKCQIPFKLVDQIGVELGFSVDSVRINLLIEYVYDKSNEHGNLYLTMRDIMDCCKRHELQFDDEVIDLIIKRLVKIVPIAEPYYTTYHFFSMEKYVENFCLDLIETIPL